MRLLFFGTREGYGGTETHLVETAAAMAAAGHDVAAFVQRGQPIHQGLARHGRVALFHGRFRRSSDLLPTLRLVRAARKWRPEWLIASFKPEYYSTALVSRACGARCAIFRHTDLPMRAASARALPRIAHRLFVPSQFLRDHLIHLGMPPARIHVSVNSVDTETLRPDAAARQRSRDMLGIAADDIVIGYAGRIEREKGVHVLFNALTSAMQQERRIRALWIGDGAWAPDLTERAAAAPHRTSTGWRTLRHTTTRWMCSRCHPPDRKRSAGRSSKHRRAASPSWGADWAAYLKR